MRVLAPLALLLACAGSAGCSALSPRSPVTFASQPPGATVLIDGRATGFVTPCQIGLSVEDRFRVDFELDGYVPATRTIEKGGELETVFWHEMNAGTRTWRFPLWLNIDDFFVPVRARHPLQPSRIFVELKRVADSEE